VKAKITGPDTIKVSISRPTSSSANVSFPVNIKDELDRRDEENRKRENHIGTQGIETIDELETALNEKADVADISLVGKTNNYNDLSNIPDLNFDPIGSADVVQINLNNHIENDSIHFIQGDIEISQNQVVDLISDLQDLDEKIDNLDLSSWDEDGAGYIKPKDSNKVKVEHIDGAYPNTNPEGFISNYIVSEEDVRQHEESLIITESQVSDLDKYTQKEVDDLLDDKEDNLTFSTGLTRTENTITTNDGQINHNNLLNSHNLTTDIDHNQLTNYDANRHFLQNEIEISESQISDLQDYYLASNPDGFISEINSNDVTTALGFTPENSGNKGQNNGYASLDSGGKIPATQLPSTVMEFKGSWNADTNTPTLADGTGNSGDVYIVSVAGTQDLGSGSIDFAEGDWVLYNGTIWEKSINSNKVVSVNTQQGVVELDSDDIPEGSSNLYDKTVSFSGGTNVTIGGTYPNFTITDNSINSSALDNYVPYTGATDDVDLGSNDLTLTGNINGGRINLSDRIIINSSTATLPLDITSVNSNQVRFPEPSTGSVGFRLDHSSGTNWIFDTTTDGEDFRFTKGGTGGTEVQISVPSNNHNNTEIILGGSNGIILRGSTPSLFRHGLNSLGDVGIGTTSPDETLHVAGTGLFEDDVQVDGVLKLESKGFGSSNASITFEGASAYIGAVGGFIDLTSINLGSGQIRGNANGGANMFGNTSFTAPRYSFRGDLGTGIGETASDTLAVYTDGDVRLEISPTGESTFTNDVDVQGDLGVEGDIISDSTYKAIITKITIDVNTTLSSNSEIGKVITLEDDVKLTLTDSESTVMQRYSVILKQDATGGRIVTWGNVKLPGGVSPVLSSSANSTDIVEFIWDGTSWHLINFIGDSQ